VIHRPWLFLSLMLPLLAAGILLYPSKPRADGRVYFALPTTNGMPRIPDCNDGEVMADVRTRALWVCTHRVWWSVVP